MRSPALLSPRRRGLAVLTAGALIASPLALAASAQADVSTKIAAFPYSQTWSNPDLITTNDDWSGVTGVQGYLGQDLTGSTGTDPQTVTGDSTVANDTDVLANSTASVNNGGVIEVEGDTIAIQGSGTADAPYVAFHLDLSGQSNVTFGFDARDLDSSADDAAQQVAVQYRLGASGAYTNIPDGYIADATTAGSATQVTAKDVALPAAADNQPSVFVRVITSNAAGNDELVGIDDITISAEGGTSALALTNPGPQSSTVGTPIAPLTLTAGGGSAPYTFSATNLPAGLELDPDTDEITGTPTAPGTSTVEISVTDDDGTTDTESFVWTVDAAPTVRPISEIQGTGATSPFVGTTVITRGVVTAAYPSGGFFGFYIQTPGSGATDIDLATHTASDGVFVRQPSGAIAVVPGDYVEVTGEVAEFAGATQIQVPPADIEVLDEDVADVVTTTTSSWPRAAAQKESLEGMRFRPTGDFTVSNTFSTNNFGEVGLAQGNKPLIQRTEVELPGPAASSPTEADNLARAVVLDDGASTNFLGSGNGNLTPPYISTTAPVIVGAKATFTADVIFTEGGAPASPTYRFQPLTTVVGPANAGSPATFENIRTAAPDEALINETGTADLKVASFNVLNYFTTLGDANDDNVGDGGCTPFRDRDGDGDTVSGGCDQRGAWDPQDFERQQTKIVSAINALDADVVGLMEIENSLTLGETPDEATNSLVAALNADAGAGTWAANPSSTELPAGGMDVITNAIIYKPANVDRVGQSRALGTLSDAGEAFDNAREPLGQVFTPDGGGDPFLFVVNHFKSKGSPGPNPGDADSGDGQSASNGSRKLQAAALRDWVATVQAETKVDSVVLAGDFNSYAMEDPLRILYDAGYADVEQHFANGEYSYSFSGLSGSLDHILVNGAALKRSTGTDIWNINGGESLALEYSRYHYHGTDFHAAGPYRSSDHDPVLLGLLDTAPAGPPPPPPAPGAVDTTLTGTAPQIVYGEAGSVTVKVAPASATGMVRVTRGKALVGVGTLASGSTSIALPATSLPVGTHTLTLSYAGDAEHKASYGAVDVKVVKAKPRLKIKVKPERIVAGVTKARIVVKVRADGFTPTGKVRVRIAGTTYKVPLKEGKGFVMMTLDKPRTYVAKVRYSGDRNTEAARAKREIEVEHR
jgi:5'-nucleotidase